MLQGRSWILFWLLSAQRPKSFKKRVWQRGQFYFQGVGPFLGGSAAQIPKPVNRKVQGPLFGPLCSPDPSKRGSSSWTLFWLLSGVDPSKRAQVRRMSSVFKLLDPFLLLSPDTSKKGLAAQVRTIRTGARKSAQRQRKRGEEKRREIEAALCLSGAGERRSWWPWVWPELAGEEKLRRPLFGRTGRERRKKGRQRGPAAWKQKRPSPLSGFGLLNTFLKDLGR